VTRRASDRTTAVRTAGTAAPTRTIPNEQSEWLVAHIPGAEAHEYDGGHLPDAATHQRVYAWLRGEV